MKRGIVTRVNIFSIALLFHTTLSNCSSLGEHGNLFVKTFLKATSPCEIKEGVICANCVMFCLTNTQCYGYACIAEKCHLFTNGTHSRTSICDAGTPYFITRNPGLWYFVHRIMPTYIRNIFYLYY